MAKFIISAQTRAANEGIELNDTRLRSCSIFHEDGSPVVSLKGSGCMRNPARYSVSAHLVFTATAAAPIQVALFEDGEQVPGSLIAVVPAAIADVVSADLTTEVSAGSDARVSLRTISTAPVTSGSFVVERIS